MFASVCDDLTYFSIIKQAETNNNFSVSVKILSQAILIKQQVITATQNADSLSYWTANKSL